MDCNVRRATDDDASGISLVVISALRESNSKDYSPEVIARVEQSFSPQAILRLLKQRHVYVASADQRIIATASLEMDVIRSVFVDPCYQGGGIGRRLMSEILSDARRSGIEIVHVPSSITAQGFYAALGFQKVRDEFYGAEQTIIMCKVLEG
ncbi:GNAT family N-acetyltransferase [Pseudomonas sp. MYb187]|uniref:GNAT family N-acetyltransferase n=1 Tax=Pseudomonas TaxID=286 RepID=UPI000CFAF703|nr:GNAT family N-acetyltransferase [Pseudomonas sp. MYb187]PRA59611.1 GNAT family N-acetyltransferase [Pseudomonas sp. MYb187]